MFLFVMAGAWYLTDGVEGYRKMHPTEKDNYIAAGVPTLPVAPYSVTAGTMTLYGPP